MCTLNDIMMDNTFEYMKSVLHVSFRKTECKSKITENSLSREPYLGRALAILHGKLLLLRGLCRLLLF